jgi:YesN/AraC family two-component response regulator
LLPPGGLAQSGGFGKTALAVKLMHQVASQEAKYLLDHENASVTQAALSVGYNDPNYFSKVFQKLE